MRRECTAENHSGGPNGSDDHAVALSKFSSSSPKHTWREASSCTLFTSVRRSCNSSRLSGYAIW
jgi:hypothetical protein